LKQAQEANYPSIKLPTARAVARQVIEAASGGFGSARLEQTMSPQGWKRGSRVCSKRSGYAR
jgi:hypothetical protein